MRRALCRRASQCGGFYRTPKRFRPRRFARLRSRNRKLARLLASIRNRIPKRRKFRLRKSPSLLRRRGKSRLDKRRQNRSNSFGDSRRIGCSRRKFRRNTMDSTRRNNRRRRNRRLVLDRRTKLAPNYRNYSKRNSAERANAGKTARSRLRSPRRKTFPPRGTKGIAFSNFSFQVLLCLTILTVLS